MISVLVMRQRTFKSDFKHVQVKVAANWTQWHSSACHLSMSLRDENARLNESHRNDFE